MDIPIRSVVLVVGLVVMVLLYYVNMYVAEKYWLPAITDEDDGDVSE